MPHDLFELQTLERGEEKLTEGMFHRGSASE